MVVFGLGNQHFVHLFSLCVSSQSVFCFPLFSHFLLSAFSVNFFLLVFFCLGWNNNIKTNCDLLIQ